jgi:plastocyanin
MPYSKSILGAGLLALVSMAFLPSCGGSYSSPVAPSSPAPTPTPGPGADVTILISGNSGGMSFSPASASVKVGQTVAWKNNDAITHAIAQDGGAGFNTSNIAPGATSGAVAITAAGTLGYHCTIHPSMTGNLSVTQ